MSGPNWLKLVAVAIMAVGLSACFESETELIAADEADFPFDTITYSMPDKREYTLTRDGAAYTSPEEPDGPAIRLKEVAENTYVAQMSDADDDGPYVLYGLVRVSADRKSFTLVHAVADDQAREIAGEGRYGLRICDDGYVCFDSIDAYTEFALETPPDEERQAVFEIVKIQ